jgi:hypothetical protein
VRSSSELAGQQDRTRGRELWAERRHEILEFLGGCCVRCGFDDWRALQIDHVHGGGTKEIRRIGSNHQRAYYQHIREHANNYQCLCANCNWIKRYERGETVRV